MDRLLQLEYENERLRLELLGVLDELANHRNVGVYDSDFGPIQVHMNREDLLDFIVNVDHWDTPWTGGTNARR